MAVWYIFFYYVNSCYIKIRHLVLVPVKTFFRQQDYLIYLWSLSTFSSQSHWTHANINGLFCTVVALTALVIFAAEWLHLIKSFLTVIMWSLGQSFCPLFTQCIVLDLTRSKICNLKTKEETEMNDELQMRQNTPEGNAETFFSVYIYGHPNFSGPPGPGHHHPLNKDFCT